MASKSLIFVLLSTQLLAFGLAYNYRTQTCSAGPFTNPDQQFFLAIINDVRQFVAAGQLPGFPAASNMAYVEWSTDLEKTAQNEANSCKNRTKSCPNSKGTSNGFLVGTYRSRCPYAVRSTYALQAVVASWFDEYQSFDPKNVQNFRSCAAPNFSQMIFGNSYYMGCGRVYDTDGEFYTMNLICGVNAAGNVYGQPIYKVGTPCTECYPECRCDVENYPALCHLYNKNTKVGGY